MLRLLDLVRCTFEFDLCLPNFFTKRLAFCRQGVSLLLEVVSALLQVVKLIGPCLFVWDLVLQFSHFFLGVLFLFSFGIQINVVVTSLLIDLLDFEFLDLNLLLIWFFASLVSLKQFKFFLKRKHLHLLRFEILLLAQHSSDFFL